MLSIWSAHRCSGNTSILRKLSRLRNHSWPRCWPRASSMARSTLPKDSIRSFFWPEKIRQRFLPLLAALIASRRWKRFLNSHYYLEEFVVFGLVKSDLRVSLRVKNMRRRFTEGGISLSEPNKCIPERAAHEAQEFDEAYLRNERAYYLEISVSKGSL